MHHALFLQTKHFLGTFNYLGRNKALKLRMYYVLTWNLSRTCSLIVLLFGLIIMNQKTQIKKLLYTFSYEMSPGWPKEALTHPRTI